MTLNSIDWEEEIIIRDDDGLYKSVKIGEYIDNMINKNPENVQYLGDIKNKEMNDTYYIDVSKKEIYVPSINEKGKIEWKRVTALTKHLPINKDGTNTLVEVTTNSGRVMTATKAKSFLTRIDNMVKAIRGDEIKIGMYLPFTTTISDFNTNEMLHINHFTKSCVSFNKVTDIIPNVILSNGTFDISKNELKKISPITNNDKIVIDNAIHADAKYDKITKIREVYPTHNYVYDLTVEDNKTFTLSNGLLCMDTFHSAGIGSKGTTALGVPRVKELLSISRNLKTPLMQIFLEKKYQHNLDMANKIASYIKYTTIGNLRNKIDVYYDPNPFKDGGFMDKDNVKNVFHSYNPGKHSCQSDITSLPWLMRIVFDREKMMNKEVTLLDMKSKFCNFWEGRYANMKGLRKEERVLLEKVTQCSILSNNDNDKVPIMHLRFDMTNFDFGTIVNFTEIFIDNFKLKGINGIDDIYGTPEERMIRLDGPDEQVEVDKEYVIYTKGVNLLELRGINGIDFSRTICNDVAQIYEIFGIEAARASLLREMKIVLEGAGNTVNFQHLSILVDVMTATGSCISIDRHGINKIDTNPFARASFEKTVDQFLTAAVFGEKDSMNSVSSRIMAGLVVKGGTGVCNIRLDTELLEKSEFVEDMEEKYMKTFAGVTQDPVIKDIVEKEEEEDIFMPM